MASRDYTKHTVNSIEPCGLRLGDEYYNPTSNILYKRLAVNGTTVSFLPIVTADSNNNLTLTGNLTVGNLIKIERAAGNVNIGGVAPSTGATTGALTVAGGVGIGGNLNVGGNLTVSGNITSVSYETITNTEYVSILSATTVNAATIGNISANMVGTGTYLTALNASNLSSGTVPTAQLSGAYTSVTGLGTLTALTVSGTTTAATINATAVNAPTIGNVNAVLTGATGTFSTWANVTGTTTSTSNITGALRVSGGVGVADSVYVGNRVGYVWSANSVSSAYTVFNSTLNSIDTVFA